MPNTNNLITLINQFAESYGKVLDNFTIQAWVYEFNGIDLNLLKKALIKTKAREEFFPSPAKVKEHLINSQTVWQQLMKASCNVNAYRYDPCYYIKKKEIESTLNPSAIAFLKENHIGLSEISNLSASELAKKEKAFKSYVKNYELPKAKALPQSQPKAK